jgi:NAD+ synthase (glutamine-hydrolysing)
MQAASAERYMRIEVPFALSVGKFEEVKDLHAESFQADSWEVRYHTPEEEIAYVPSISES